MLSVDAVKKGKRDFGAQRFTASMFLFAASKPIIISCVDPRADPAHVLGLEFGDALVISKIGGRITPATLQTIAMLQTIDQVKGTTSGKGNLVLVNLTACWVKLHHRKPDLCA